MATSFDTTMANLGINRTSNGAGTASNSLGSEAMDQSDFLTLMTAQMKNQDPFDPVDNKEMLAQMAQFSSLAGINDVNSTLQQISTKLDALASAKSAA